MLFSEVAARAAAFLGLSMESHGPVLPTCILTYLFLLAAPVPRQFAFEPDSVAYEDPDTGLKFSSYTSARGISWRVAIPEDIPEGDKIFDTVLQVEAPIDVGWAGFAWGGHMTYNPLTIVWPNGNDVVLSSRIA